MMSFYMYITWATSSINYYTAFSTHRELVDPTTFGTDTGVQLKINQAESLR